MATGNSTPRVGLSGRQREGHACGQGQRRQRHSLDFSFTHLSSPLSVSTTLEDKQAIGWRH
jgi:hypothetical protein